MVLHAKHNILTTTLIILTHVSALRTNSNIKWPVFQRAEAWWGRTIRCTTEAHDNTTVHGDRIISSHAENNLRQAEFKAKFINGDFTRRACVKFVYHVIFQDDPYKLGMTWSFDLCYGNKLVSRLQLSLKRGFRGITLQKVFFVAERMFSNRLQMTSQRGKNKKVAFEAELSVSLMFSPHFEVFCDLLLCKTMATKSFCWRHLPVCPWIDYKLEPIKTRV